jgi:hypothetical protein
MVYSEIRYYVVFGKCVRKIQSGAVLHHIKNKLIIDLPRRRLVSFGRVETNAENKNRLKTFTLLTSEKIFFPH